MAGGHVWSEMSENPVRESEPKSKNPQVVERAPPQSSPQVCFAQCYHDNAESSTSWPHAHTCLYSVCSFLTCILWNLGSGLKPHITAQHFMYNRYMCRVIWNSSLLLNVLMDHHQITQLLLNINNLPIKWLKKGIAHIITTACFMSR